LKKRFYHFFSDIAVILSSILQNILTVREKDFINEQFGRSVDPTVRDYLLLSTKEEGPIIPLSVLFFDIRNFTSLSEKIGPTQSVVLLNDIFSRCDEIIRKEGGFINQFTGDGFMAVFGAPEISENHERQAVRAALSILQTVSLPCGMGIASGDAVAGTIGSAKRKEYTVIGDTVNTASRIESLCKLFGSSLLISGTTMEQVKDEIPCFRFLGQIRLKGKKEPVGIFDLSSKGACYDDSFTAAVTCYYRSDFSSAIEQFTTLQKTYPGDKAITWFITRCTARKESTDPWDGIELMTEK
jgi:adenylate cyclase